MVEACHHYPFLLIRQENLQKRILCSEGVFRLPVRDQQGEGQGANEGKTAAATCVGQASQRLGAQHTFGAQRGMQTPIPSLCTSRNTGEERGSIWVHRCPSNTPLVGKPFAKPTQTQLASCTSDRSTGASAPQEQLLGGDQGRLGSIGDCISSRDYGFWGPGSHTFC